MLCKHDSQLFIMTRSLSADCEQTVAQQKQACECVSSITLLMVLLLKLHHHHHHRALMLHNVLTAQPAAPHLGWCCLPSLLLPLLHAGRTRGRWQRGH